MKPHSEKKNPASEPQTTRMLNAGLDRAGNPEYPDHAPSDKFQKQSASLKRRGNNKVEDYPDVSLSTGAESTGNDGRGSRKGSR